MQWYFRCRVCPQSFGETWIACKLFEIVILGPESMQKMDAFKFKRFEMTSLKFITKIITQYDDITLSVR